MVIMRLHTAEYLNRYWRIKKATESNLEVKNFVVKSQQYLWKNSSSFRAELKRKYRIVCCNGFVLLCGKF